MRVFAAVVLALLMSPHSAASEPLRAAVFNFELVDSSLEGAMTGPKQAEVDRLAMLSERLRAGLAENARYEVLDIARVAERAGAQNLQACGGCDAKLAAELGADLAVTGTVQKVSNLILNINIYVRDAGTGALVQAASADIRGNTDESWRRGLDWLLKHRILAGPAPQ